MPDKGDVPMFKMQPEEREVGVGMEKVMVLESLLDGFADGA